MLRGYKIRLYPTKEQEHMIWNHIGACRFIWNYMLDKQHDAHERGEKHLSQFDMMKLITPLKREAGYMWLREVSNTSLQRVCSDLEENYRRFFKKVSGYPSYKSKRTSKTAYPVACNEFYFKDGYVNISRIGKVKYKTDFVFPQGRGHKFGNVRITYSMGKYYVSFCMERESQTQKEMSSDSVGIDLGIKELAVVAFGDQKYVFHNINKSKRAREIKRRIRHVQREMSRKYRASINKYGKYVVSKNMENDIYKFRKLYMDLVNLRTNYIHQTTHYIVEMMPSAVVMETLNIPGLLKNEHLSASISEQCFGKFIDQMRYKCEERGIPFIQADRFYPSSKTCSCCGGINKGLKLRDRTYICEQCGTVIDRDYNAALNLMKYVDLCEKVTA